MEFLHQCSTNSSQWNLYQQLELIPASVENPVNAAHPLTTALNFFWRPLLGLLMEELVEEQKVDYLERCWELDEFGKTGDSANSLQRFWILIN